MSFYGCSTESTLTYCIPVWSASSNGQEKTSLQRVINKVQRIYKWHKERLDLFIVTFYLPALLIHSEITTCIWDIISRFTNQNGDSSQSLFLLLLESVTSSRFCSGCQDIHVQTWRDSGCNKSFPEDYNLQSCCCSLWNQSLRSGPYLRNKRR